jgi:hypothetical protein
LILSWVETTFFSIFLKLTLFLIIFYKESCCFNFESVSLKIKKLIFWFKKSTLIFLDILI